MTAQYAYQSQDSSAIPNQIQGFDSYPVAGHLHMMGWLAERSGVAGHLTISKFEPANTQRHFRPDDLGGMVCAVMSFKDDPAANVYMMLALVDTNVPAGKKGRRGRGDGRARLRRRPGRRRAGQTTPAT